MNTGADRACATAPPTPMPITETLLHQIVQLAKAWRGLIRQQLAEVGLHIGQEQLLLQLWREDGLSQAQLAERMRVEAPTVTKMLQRLERAKLVRRSRDRAGTRAYLVHLTDAGRALREPVETVWSAAERSVTGKLDPAELGTLRELLRRLDR
jgi:MarR family transcriptional regulator, organic hydroperoxide resistance regulator